MPSRRKRRPLRLIPIALTICVTAILTGYFAFVNVSSNVAKKAGSNVIVSHDLTTGSSSPFDTTVDLTQKQLNAIQIEPAEVHGFYIQIEAVGSVAYREKDEISDKKPDDASKFLVANILESDSALVHMGQSITAKIAAYPDRVFNGKVSMLGVTIYDSGGNPAVDPITHRTTARCIIADRRNELYPGMLASIVIQVGEPVESVRIPQDGVVREGDGTMTAWVTTDRHHFIRRTVNIGLQQDGFDQILEGVQAGELVVVYNSVFLSNMNNADFQ